MKITIYLFSLFAIGMVTNGCNSKKEEKPESPEELFLSQKPPGLSPQVFAPGIVSTDDLELEPVFAPNMKEFYFLRQSKGERSKNFVIHFENGEWSNPVERSTSEGEVFIATDNNTIHLGNTYRERTDDGWTDERSLGAPFDEFPIMRLTASSSGTYFFDERDSIGTIRYSRIVNGKREAPKVLEKQVNSGTYTSHPFIAPDETYLIWDSDREDGYGRSDLYICFRQKDGSWGSAINMGDKINTDSDDFYGSVTSDGRYFYFSRVKLGESIEESEANIFWVDAKLIMDLQNN